ncbi:MAG: hypothetical protein QGH39_08020 [Candidatus Thermoplasmatota archaeon]|nr:hypothetical protein [Candidatus Thermoplasmatota archaeon]
MKVEKTPQRSVTSLRIFLFILILASVIGMKSFLPLSKTIRMDNPTTAVNNPLDCTRSTTNVSYMEIQLDWEEMGWSDPDGEYHAGEYLYLIITTYHNNGSICQDENISVSITSSAYGWMTNWTGWRPQDPYVLELKDGIARIPEFVKYYKAGDVEINASLDQDPDIKAILDLKVNPAELVSVVSDPEICEVRVGSVVNINISGFDKFGNPVEILNEKWWVDGNINADGSQEMSEPGIFNSIEYFPGITRNGSIHVTASGTMGASVQLDIPVSVENIYDICWCRGKSSRQLSYIGTIWI